MTWKKAYNQKRQAYLTQKQRQRRLKIKEQTIQQNQAQLNKYYSANSIQVLITFAEYTELEKGQKLWSDFSRTLHDIQQGVSSIVEIMKLREIADSLIRDYWDTAHGKIKEGEHWNNLSDDQQQRLIKYWSQEKIRQEKQLATALTQQTQDSQQYEKEIELAKYHEERGKKNCKCHACQEKKAIQTKIKKEWAKEEQIPWVKADCGNCYEHKKVDPETGLCKMCAKQEEREDE